MPNWPLPKQRQPWQQVENKQAALVFLVPVRWKKGSFHIKLAIYYLLFKINSFISVSTYFLLSMLQSISASSTDDHGISHYGCDWKSLLMIMSQVDYWYSSTRLLKWFKINQPKIFQSSLAVLLIVNHMYL